jgi:hypothetical protein
MKQLNRTWTLVLVFVLALGIGPLFADQAETSAPAALALETIKDFGAVSKGQRITHEFEIRNDGDAVLEITDVRPSCGCTVAEYDKTVAPGATGTVKATVDTRNFKGGIAKAVRVFTNDAANPQIDLVIKANVKSQIEVSPGYARFIAVYGEPQRTSVQSVWSPERSNLKILEAESPYPFVEVSFREANEDEQADGASGRQWQVEVELDKDAPVGPLADFIVLTTDHPKQKTLRIPVSGFVRPVMSVTPRIADFGRRELSEPQTKSLEIRNLSSAQVGLGEITTDVAGLDAEIELLEDGRLYKVLLTLQPGMAKGDFEGLVTISTNSSKQPTIEVSVKGVVL